MGRGATTCSYVSKTASPLFFSQSTSPTNNKPTTQPNRRLLIFDSCLAWRHDQGRVALEEFAPTLLTVALSLLSDCGPDAAVVGRNRERRFRQREGCPRSE